MCWGPCSSVARPLKRPVRSCGKMISIVRMIASFFGAIKDLHERNEAVDLVTVIEELRKKGKLDAVGGSQTITNLSNAVPTAANVEYHAKIVEEKSLRRQLINAATDIAATGYEEDTDIARTIDEAEQKILLLPTGPKPVGLSKSVILCAGLWNASRNYMIQRKLLRGFLQDLRILIR